MDKVQTERILGKLFGLLNIIESQADESLMLLALMDIAVNKILFLTGATRLPQELEFIVLELVVLAYNRLGSEGLQSESIDGGINITYFDVDSAMKPYTAYIDLYNARNKPRAKFKFI